MSRLPTVLPAALLSFAAAALSQTGSVGVRYQGRLTLGPANQNARAGTVISVLASKALNDYQECGTTVVQDDGRYVLEVPAIPVCIAPNADDRRTLHVFLVQGENVGSVMDGASLDEPRSLGKTRHQDLRGTPVLAFPDAATGSTRPVGVRFYGTARNMKGGYPAPGVVVVLKGETGRDCGQGRVVDGSGFWWLDVPAEPGCVAGTYAAKPMHYSVQVGETVVATPISAASLDLPRSLGRGQRQDLRIP